MPDVPEAELSQILAWEKEITGFYISGHPLDVYRDLMGKLTQLKQILDGEVKDRQLVRVAGLVTIVKRIVTKKGDAMAFVTLEDYSRDIETVVFPNLFYQSTELFTEDRPVVVQGRVDVTENGVKLLAEKVWPMEEYKTDYFILTTSAQATQDKFERLRATAKARHGDHAVYLYLTDRKKNMALEWEFWLDGSSEATAEVETIFGAGSVRER